MGKGSGRRPENAKYTEGYGAGHDRTFGPRPSQYPNDDHLRSDRTVMPDGRTLLHHDADSCSGTFCSLHNPSKHALSDAPLNWRGDRGIMERICKHGIGHPDPDGLAHIARTAGEDAARIESVHGCDGCCYKDALVGCDLSSDHDDFVR